MNEIFNKELSILSEDSEILKEVKYVLTELLAMIGEVAPDIKDDFLKLRESFLRARQSDEYNFKSVLESVEPESVNDLIRLFSLYMILLNIIEERHETKRTIPDIEDMVNQLCKEGFDKEDILNVLGEIKFYPVFTAHPTESRRRTFLEAHHELLSDLDKIFPFGNEQASEHFRYKLMLLWQSNLIRNEKIEVLFELDNLMYIIDSSLLDSILNVNESIEKTFGKPLKESPIKLGSWIGGDRDGNPFVTNEVMTKVMKLQHNAIINTYLKHLERLKRELSISMNLSTVKEELTDSIKSEMEYQNYESEKLFGDEPFRAKISLMMQKLENRLLQINTKTELEHVYTKPSELIQDIDLMLVSLHPSNSKYLKRFRNLVITCGFHLMKLDFREHKDSINGALTEIFSYLGIADSDFTDLPQDKQKEIINQAIKRPKVELRSLIGHVTKESENIISAFIKIEWAKEVISEEIIDSFIISMTQSSRDLLAVLWFAKQSGLWHPGEKTKISITPLFETIEDLRMAPEIIGELVENEHYGQYLNDRKNRQEIMIGYSDSSKDGGMFTSNFSLNRAINHLMEMEEKLGIKFRLFHGRGGSISRGGGSTESALLASPAKSVSGFLKTTEQGEVISSKYLNPKNAEYNLVKTLSMLLKKSVYDTFNVRIDCGKNDRFTNLMQSISDTSYKEYRNLAYETPGFIDYFKQATPIFFIQRLNIGSRPSKRKDSNRIEDLRAIPWVFSWTQNRSIIPAWYGTGSGLANVKERESLRECYSECPFFRTTIDNVAMSLLKTDMSIANLYNDFVESTQLRDVVWKKINDEFYKTVELIMYVRNEENLLGKEELLRQSILLRKPYLSALSLFQIELINEYKNAKYEALQDKIISKISTTIVGIAQGMRNTG